MGHQKKPIPHVSKYMTSNPHSIRVDQTLECASDLMSRYKIRHLPVLEAGKLCGILSDRDVKFALSLEGLDASKTQVADIAREEVYVTPPETPLDDVVRTMADRRLGSAVVVDNGKVVGIFTAVDAMRRLDHLLETRLSH